jgi:DedD protein
VHTMASSSEDTEITLGVGKLLGLFFLLAAICGIFFSIGYSLGKSSGREQALNDQPAPTTVSADTGSSTSNSGKPAAGVAMKADAETAPGENANAPQQGSLTFYHSLKQAEDPQQTAPADGKAATEATAASTKSADAGASPALTSANAQPAAASVKTAEVIGHTSPVTGPGTLVVQIAAVSREDDAVALAGALRKKSYNVFVVNNPVTNDKLYHVQVGPFSTLAEAQAMKAKLMEEGYNPIIKK